MKKSIATIISVAGVLGAGAAAYAVNSSVLSATSSNDLIAATTSVATFATDGSTDSPSGDVVVAGAAVASPLTIASATPSTVAPLSTTPGTVAPLSSTPVPSSTRTSYKVGAAGSVILDSAGGVLTIAGVSPATGWTATRTIGGAQTATVHFTSATMRVEFVATLSNGAVGVDVTSVALPPPSTTRRYDDDDDDRLEDHDDDRDEDDEDDEDHDEDHEREDD